MRPPGLARPAPIQFSTLHSSLFACVVVLCPHLLALLEAAWQGCPARAVAPRPLDALPCLAVLLALVLASPLPLPQVLGGKYGQRDPRQVLGDPQYKQDVLRCGPLLGMTFILKAARDIPLQEVARWARQPWAWWWLGGRGTLELARSSPGRCALG